MFINLEEIKELLASEITGYRISRETDVKQQNYDNYKLGKSDFDNMPVKTLVELQKFINKERKNMNKIIDLHGKERMVDLSTKEFSSYNDLKDETIYNVMTDTGYYTKMVVPGNVENVELDMIEVVDEFGKNRRVNMNTAKIRSYDNVKKKIVYNGQTDDDYWVDFVTDGVVDDIEERLNTWNNTVKLIYAEKVKFDAKKYDPDNEIWNDVVEKVKENEEQFFTKTGNWRKQISPKMKLIIEE